MINTCSVCKHYVYALPSEPFLMRETPNLSWNRAGTDVFEFAGKSYLVVFDAYSNYLEVEKLEDLTARTLIDKLKAIFAKHGIPMVVTSDNGPQFASYEFKAFSISYDFEHITSSLRFPRSNGLAEKGVQIVKRIFKKTNSVGEGKWLGLLNYKSIPLEG